ncbi:DUF1835 domain-containing protein [Subsaxibacter sp. CAU 1640]|uniref:DUF1835 domain-containing protein n=1 Tax=Subsaxibacter sp. CAU 1640 TaxID=2933271 RepID=UPI002002AB21|nr:DUF1835 domain-containing protein [Subsaxibacter sp. CAU 1640]MCK7590957.1 DUF1835 domain-containing protein [Subsaxibacter sp. CAU 1640]
MKQTLHITNGHSLTNFLNDIDIKGDFLTWQEMLCEGPTTEIIDSDEFFESRKQFLLEFYDIEVNEEEFRSEISVLNNPNKYSEIVLWFEYDLFCHINLMAVVSLIYQKGVKLPLYLVCSGRVEGEKELKGLAELSTAQLQKHYKAKISLEEKDIDLITSLWKTYCGKDHNLFKPVIVKSSSFPYLSNCLKAHLQRFPDSKTGLSGLELNLLNIVKQYDIKSKKHLMGYALNYQGYYGYGDTQLERIIEKLSIFFEESRDHLKLNRKGHEAILGQHNYISEMKSDMFYGGIKKYDFLFSKSENKLVKTV